MLRSCRYRASRTLSYIDSNENILNLLDARCNKWWWEGKRGPSHLARESTSCERRFDVQPAASSQPFLPRRRVLMHD